MNNLAVRTIKTWFTKFVDLWYLKSVKSWFKNVFRTTAEFWNKLYFLANSLQICQFFSTLARPNSHMQWTITLLLIVFTRVTFNIKNHRFRSTSSNILRTTVLECIELNVVLSNSWSLIVKVTLIFMNKIDWLYARPIQDLTNVMDDFFLF